MCKEMCVSKGEGSAPFAVIRSLRVRSSDGVYI